MTLPRSGSQPAPETRLSRAAPSLHMLGSARPACGHPPTCILMLQALSPGWRAGAFRPKLGQLWLEARGHPSPPCPPGPQPQLPDSSEMSGVLQTFFSPNTEPKQYLTLSNIVI